MDKTEKIKYLTRYFLNKKNLGFLNTKIKMSDKLPKCTEGQFDLFNNEILFNKNLNFNIVETSAHEVEHAYQYAQIGRIGKGFSEYAKKSKRVLGSIDNPDESMEAYKYFVASSQYPKDIKDENLATCSEYTNNYLEIKAREAGTKAKQNYEASGFATSSQFFFGM